MLPWPAQARGRVRATTQARARAPGAPPGPAALARATTIPVIASGGAGNLDHMVEVLEKGQADAVLAASIFHFGIHTVGEAKAHFAKHGVPVRPSFKR